MKLKTLIPLLVALSITTVLAFTVFKVGEQSPAVPEIKTEQVQPKIQATYTYQKGEDVPIFK